MIVLSLSLIRAVFSNLNTCTMWSLQLLNINKSKKAGIGYCSRQISLFPTQRLNKLLDDISKAYLGQGKKHIDQYREVREYDGTADAQIIYKLSTDDELISTECVLLKQAIAKSNTDADPFKYTSAYLIKGEISIEGVDYPIKLISMQNPVTALKHKFLFHNGTLEELSQKIISLRPTIDVIILGETVYFLTLAGENLFNMARSYKSVCQEKIQSVETANIIYGIDNFKKIAGSGHNPRRFIAFDEDRLNALKEEEIRKKMAKQFAIPLDEDGIKFDATAEGASEKIVKLLCNKGMMDPFKNFAVEVDGSRKWK